MKRQIKVNAETKAFLVKAFGCTLRMVDKSLHLHEKSNLALRIQKLAMEKGGQVMVTLPECETIHTHDHHMIQQFSNGAVLDIYMPTGECKVTHNGKVLRTLTIVTIPELEKLQSEIAAI